MIRSLKKYRVRQKQYKMDKTIYESTRSILLSKKIRLTTFTYIVDNTADSSVNYLGNVTITW